MQQLMLGIDNAIQWVIEPYGYYLHKTYYSLKARISLDVMTLSITTLSITTDIMTLGITTLSITTLSILCHYTEYLYAEFHYF